MFLTSSFVHTIQKDDKNEGLSLRLAQQNKHLLARISAQDCHLIFFGISSRRSSWNAKDTGRRRKYTTWIRLQNMSRTKKRRWKEKKVQEDSSSGSLVWSLLPLFRESRPTIITNWSKTSCLGACLLSSTYFTQPWSIYDPPLKLNLCCSCSFSYRRFGPCVEFSFALFTTVSASLNDSHSLPQCLSGLPDNRPSLQ